MMRRVAPTLRWRALTRASSAAGWRRGSRAATTTTTVRVWAAALVCARSARAVLRRGHGLRVGTVREARRRDRGARRRVRRGGRARSEPEACAVQHAWYCTNLGAASAGMLSIDGRCKMLDARENGYARSEAVGALVLRACEDVTASALCLSGSAVRQIMVDRRA